MVVSRMYNFWQWMAMLLMMCPIKRLVCAFVPKNSITLLECTFHASTALRPASTLRKASVSGILYEKSSGDATCDVTVKLFTKEGCTLCDKVKDLLLSISDDFPHNLVAVDITDDDNRVFWDKYKYDIPVLHLNDLYFAKHRLSREEAIEGIISCREGKFVSPPGEPNGHSVRISVSGDR